MKNIPQHFVDLVHALTAQGKDDEEIIEKVGLVEIELSKDLDVLRSRPPSSGISCGPVCSWCSSPCTPRRSVLLRDYTFCMTCHGRVFNEVAISSRLFPGVFH